MNAGEVISLARIKLDDLREPYLWADADLMQYLAAAQQDASIRARLIRDTSTAEVCTILLQAGVGRYPLHEKIFRIAPVPDAVRTPRRALRRLYPSHVLELTSVGEPTLYLEGDGFLQLYPAPASAQMGPLQLDVYRLPLIDPQNDADALEIPERCHEGLVYGTIKRAYERTDADTYAPDKAALAEQEFTRWFGAKPDANMDRKQREGRAPTVRCSW